MRLDSKTILLAVSFSNAFEKRDLSRSKQAARTF